MASKLNRRTFLKTGTAATAGLALAGQVVGQTAMAADKLKPVRVGLIGIGRRGKTLLELLLKNKGVQVLAICDVDGSRISMAQEMIEKAGQPKPEGYSNDPKAYRKLLTRKDIDAVIIASPWELHTPMSVEAMKAGKYTACEVPCALTLEECWNLVKTHEATGAPFMMMENWCFRRDNLAVLKMIRKGLLGQIVHCHCAHSHDCIDHWFWDTDGTPRWPAKYLIERNCDQYPTHSLGPVMSWMDINHGDAFATLTSTATASTSINAHFAHKFGPDDPRAKAKYKQGDIVTSVVKTHRGRTIVINYDMQLPRPYDNRWMIQGTLGLYDEDKANVYLVDRSPKYHEWESFKPYQIEFEHPWWKGREAKAGGLGHNGTDEVELKLFVEAVRNRTQTPIDVYDSVTMSSIVALSGASIAKGSAPVECPDFTRGKWQTRKPTFAV